MTMTTFDSQSISEFTEQAYLNYAMYVIMDRALPHISDGLKPVQRRIIYAMSELGLRHTAKPKKSARTVGDVLGKYHPHGDTACYEAMVLMAQPFSYRYPLIEGQGNWGSPDDPKSFAAMRYTEAKMSLYAGSLLGELGEGTVDWQDNFDGTLKEPTTLPARLPNILLNGTTGIAVGMATDIPPHNLSELIDGCIALLKNPNLTDDKLYQLIPAPDLPTSAEIITSADEFASIYKTGKGSYKMRATYHTDPKDNNAIIINALPYQVSGNKIIEQIAKLMNDKKLPWVVDVNDESDHENPCRIVLSLKKGKTDTASIMNHLFATTDLETSFRVNMTMIGNDGKPALKGLKPILQEWLSIRQTVVIRRLRHHLQKIDNRLHIVAGLLIAYVHIDEIITIIKEEDDAKSLLMAKFSLSPTQADAILDIKLRQLAKLQYLELQSEQDALNAQKQTIQDQLDNPNSLTRLIISELTADKKTYGDQRQSPLVIRQSAAAISPSKLIASEPATVIISKAGWIRVAKGHDINPPTMNYRTGDTYLTHVFGKTDDKLYLLDNTGRSYRLDTHALPSARGQGEPLTSLLKPSDNASFIQAFMGDDRLVLASALGYGFISDTQNLDTNQKSGKAVISLDNTANTPNALIATTFGDNDTHLALITRAGYLLICPLDELPTLKKGKGNKLIHLVAGDTLAFVVALSLQDKLLLTAGKRTLTLFANELKNYVGGRGKKGKLLPKGLQKITSVQILG